MSTRRRSLTVNSYYPVQRDGNGWTPAAENEVFIHLSTYGQIEKLHKRAAERIQRKLNHLNTTMFIFGLLIGSFGVIDTYFGDSTPVWMKIIQLIIGYTVSVITQVQTKNKELSQMSILKEIAYKCAYKAENVRHVLHMSQNARPPANSYILSINMDIQCLKVNSPIMIPNNDIQNTAIRESDV